MKRFFRKYQHAIQEYLIIIAFVLGLSCIAIAVSYGAR